MGAMLKQTYLATAREFLRDKTSMFIIILMPLLFAGFFGLVMGGTSGFTLELGVAQEDRGLAGPQILEALQAPTVAKTIHTTVASRDELLEQLQKGKVNLVLILPENLSQSLAAKQPATIETFYDGTNQTSSGAGLSIVKHILDAANLQLANAQPLLQLKEQPLQARAMRPADLFLPGTLAIAILWLGIFGTAQPLVTLREQQVLRRLSVTPLPTSILLAGQVGWRLTVGLLQSALVLLFGRFVYGFHLVGNFWLILAVISLGTLVLVSLGYFIAGVSPSGDTALAIGQIANFLMMFLSGALVPVDVLPKGVRMVANVIPLTHMTDAFRQLMVGAPAAFPLWINFAALGAWLLVLTGLSVRFFHWE